MLPCKLACLSWAKLSLCILDRLQGGAWDIQYALHAGFSGQMLFAWEPAICRLATDVARLAVHPTGR